MHGVTYDEVIEASEHITGMAALWDVDTVGERREMVEHILEPEGLYYDTELKIIAALKPRPTFLPILRLLEGIVEYKEASGLLATRHWCERNRRDTVYQRLSQWDKAASYFNMSLITSIIFTQKINDINRLYGNQFFMLTNQLISTLEYRNPSQAFH